MVIYSVTVICFAPYLSWAVILTSVSPVGLSKLKPRAITYLELNNITHFVELCSKHIFTLPLPAPSEGNQINCLLCSVHFFLGLTTMLLSLLDKFSAQGFADSSSLVIQNFMYAEAKDLHSRWWVWRSLYSTEVRITCLAWWQETTGKFWL